jgi:hypothetical protein
MSIIADACPRFAGSLTLYVVHGTKAEEGAPRL